MKDNIAAKRGWLLFMGTILLTWIAPWILFAQTPSPELIVDLCTTPHKYWNKYVMIKGHVRSVTPNPPGTNRGSYVMRDSSDADITVLTTELPAMGKEYTVSGNVEQVNPDQKVPIIREFRRVSGSEPPPAAVQPRRPAPTEVAAPVRKREPAPPPAPAPQPAAPQVREAPPAVVQPAPAPEATGISTPMMIGIAGIAVLIVIVVAVIVMRPKPAPMPAPPVSYAPKMPSAAPSHIRPPAPPPPTAARTVSAAPRSVATQVVPPPAPKATEIFFDLGADLAVTAGPDNGKRFSLTKPTITLGRSGARQNDITLSDSTVSREHAKIIYSTAEKTFRLINESTTNPVRLNGNPIDTAVIKDGDTLQLGSTIFKFSRKA